MSFNQQRNALGPALPFGWEDHPGGAFAPPPASISMPIPFPGPAARDVRQESNVLLPGRHLNHNQTMSARNGSIYLTFHMDGNLVLYRRRDNIETLLWASRTGNRGASECIMQDDGNFVIYDSRRRPVWASNTHGNYGAHLLVQDDGNLCVNLGNQCKWTSNTYAQM